MKTKRDSKKEQKRVKYLGYGVFAILIIGFLAYSGIFFPKKPMVVFYIDNTNFSILGFGHGKGYMSLMCAACDSAAAEAKIYYNGTKLCDSSNSFKTVGYGKIRVYCNKEMDKYENKIIEIKAVGYFNDKKFSIDTKEELIFQN